MDENETLLWNDKLFEDTDTGVLIEDRDAILVFLSLRAGISKYVCIYMSQQILPKKLQVTFNRSLDGVWSVVVYCAV